MHVLFACGVTTFGLEHPLKLHYQGIDLQQASLSLPFSDSRERNFWASETVIPSNLDFQL